MILRKVTAFLTGLSFFYFFPVFWHIKPFDVFAILYFLLSIKHGFRFYKFDMLFYFFLVLSYISLANSENTSLWLSSFLQTMRYTFYFFLARINTYKDDMLVMLSGMKISFWLAVFYATLDALYYYTIGNCNSINTIVPFIPEEKVLTHKSELVPIKIGNCLYYRFTGPAWDPGGIYTIMLLFGVFLAQYKKGLYYHTSGILGTLAVSRTTLVAYVWTMVYKKLKFSLFRCIWFYTSLFGLIFIMPFIFYLAIEESIINIEEGTARHAVYPALAFISILENPAYLIIGEGLRGGRVALYSLSDLPYYFFEYEEKDVLVVESIWVNYITGAGFLGFVFYLSWILIGFRNMSTFVLALLVTGLFYSFDSSQFCFIVPFFMSLKTKMQPKSLKP